ncbi:ATP-binding protein [Chimaeribacter californicus]|uniref:ATP-binding protein n=1 Tax=Chimaeribacter californicus TaxID=2060067 RepID=A0A2N5EBV3_9GAMM|nr:ATP-binding protein [Chimaeribacter californicus]PLR39590.1 ATP-binding protein [Chimaeribacter californicus]
MHDWVPDDVDLTLPAVPDSLAIASRALEAFAQTLPLGEEGLFPLDLALSEAFTNVIKHGYGYDASQQIALLFHYQQDQSTLEVALTDSGSPIPPVLLQQDKCLNINPDDMDSWPENGMGLMFIRASVDEMRYHSQDGRNTLTLVKHLHPGVAADEEAEG